MTTQTESAGRDVTYAFPGDGTFHLDGHELHIGESRRRLEPKLAETLAYLLARAGSVVTKKELLDTVWQGRHVTDDALTVVIYQLRRALGDRARAPRYIETITRRGYRWVALPVRAVEPSPAVDLGRTLEEPPLDAAPIPQRHLPWKGSRRLTMSLVPLLVLLLVTAWIGVRAGEPQGEQVGYLPFEERPTTIPIDLAETRSLIAERTPSSLERAREILSWRLAAGPRDTATLALEARALIFTAEHDWHRRPQLIRQARHTTDRALALAPTSSEVLLSRGLLALLHERDLPAAGRSLLAAQRAAPEDPEVLQATSWWLSIEGRHGAALEQARAAVALDPGVSTRWSDLSYLARAAGDDEQAVRAADIALGLDPSNGLAPSVRLWSKRALGKPHEAVREYLGHLAGRGVPEPLVAELRETFETDGWSAFHRHFAGLFPPGANPLGAAVAALYDDDSDAALDQLDLAARRGDPELLWLDSMPELAALRDEPRFATLRARLGLTAATPTARLELRWRQRLLGEPHRGT